jgi:hypothetical protein
VTGVVTGPDGDDPPGGGPSGGAEPAGPVVARHRRHRSPGRRNRYLVTYDDDEAGRIAAAASRAGLTPTSYIASAALAAADNTRPPMRGPAQVALAALADANTQIRRVGGNLNQLVALAHTTGRVPPRLEEALRLVLAAVVRVDAAADRAARTLP